MDDEEIQALARYRLEQSKENLEEAEILFNIGKYKGANNRAYYSIFHAINAVHALDGKSYKRHKDALANFNKNYVRTEIFDRTMGRKISDAEEIRHASDYDDFYIVVIDEVREQIEAADEIVDLLEKYCRERIEADSED